MDLRDGDPIEYFNRWLTLPIEPADRSVRSIMDALNRHPIVEDETAQDHILTPDRYREKEGRFRLLAENQECWHCFIREGTESEEDPPVYFETCLDLTLDFEFTEDEIFEGDHVFLSRFRRFLWWMLGSQICVRFDTSSYLRPAVRGVVFSEPLQVGEEFAEPWARRFPEAFSSFFLKEAICLPDWGAAFLNDRSAEDFTARFAPRLSNTWNGRR